MELSALCILRNYYKIFRFTYSEGQLCLLSRARETWQLSLLEKRDRQLQVKTKKFRIIQIYYYGRTKRCFKGLLACWFIIWSLLSWLFFFLGFWPHIQTHDGFCWRFVKLGTQISRTYAPDYSNIMAVDDTVSDVFTRLSYTLQIFLAYYSPLIQTKSVAKI